MSEGPVDLCLDLVEDAVWQCLAGTFESVVSGARKAIPVDCRKGKHGEAAG